MANRNKTTEPIKYLVSDDKGEFVIEVAANWKVTFSSVNPAATGGGGFREGYCLRVYEGEKLRAVYCNVKGFRDLSIPLMRKVEKQTGSAEWTHDSMGNFEQSRRVEIEASYVDEEVRW